MNLPTFKKLDRKFPHTTSINFSEAVDGRGVLSTSKSVSRHPSDVVWRRGLRQVQETSDCERVEPGTVTRCSKRAVSVTTGPLVGHDPVLSRVTSKVERKTVVTLTFKIGW